MLGIHHASPKIFITESGVVLFIYLGMAEYEGALCDAWQTAVELIDGFTVHGTTARPPGEAPNFECASLLAQHLIEGGGDGELHGV